MSVRFTIGSVLFALAIGLFAAAVMIPPWVSPRQVATTQTGPDASAMGLYLDKQELRNTPQQPELLPASQLFAPGTVLPGGSNLRVLGGESPAELNRTMVALTAWVAPQEGCGFCHGGQNGPNANWAPDYPRKEVARQMLRMVRDVNTRWTNHVGSRGVTCFTCHQGSNIPKETWSLPKEPEPPMGGILGMPRAWHTKADTIRGFFPSKPYEKYLLQGLPADGVQTHHALVNGTQPSQHNLKDAEDVYILMMQMSQALGVNCTYCHQSRQLYDWNQSPPNRLNGYSGIKMATDLNQRYFAPLDAIALPAGRGELGDAKKINCGTCHNQRAIPSGGMNRAVYPSLIGPATGIAGPANPVAAANPGIWQLARQPKVGAPAAGPDTVAER